MLNYPKHERRFYDLRDGRISAVHYGLSSNPVKLVFANANGFNALSYKAVLEPLGVHAIALDMRGQGMSELPYDHKRLKNWHVFRDDIAEFVTRYVDNPVVVAGHSFGAVSAILAAPLLKDKMSGYVGFDPVALPRIYGQISLLPGARALMKRYFPLASKSGKRKAHFESLEAAFNRLKGRGAFQGMSDGILINYLEGGTAADGEGVRLTCDPLWEQAIFVAQGHNLYKAAKSLPFANSHITFAGNYGAVSAASTRRYFTNLLGEQSIQYNAELNHMFPLEETEYATACLKRVISEMSLRL